MKIDGFGSGGSITGVKKPGEKKLDKAEKKTVASSQGAASVEGDQVDLHTHQQALDFIKQLVDNTPDLRAEEVDRVLEKMKDPEGYRINLERVAEGFLKEAILNELSRKRGGQLQ